MIYCISDIHGEYDRFMELLDRIAFGPQDTLYVLGDAVDRGPEPIRVLSDMMERPNVIPLLGNHDYMAMNCLQLLMMQAGQKSASARNRGEDDLIHWWGQGGLTTMEGFLQLSEEKQQTVLAYLNGFRLYEELTVNGRRYVLVHGGLGQFAPDKPLKDYALDDLIWDRPDYGRVYFPDQYLVTGHTPTKYIKINPRPDYIYRGGNHIAIDCGSVYGGQLGAVCLDTGEEFYSCGK